MCPKRYDLEDRLLAFAAMIVDLAEALPKTPAGNHVGNHLLRSGTSPLFHHGEAEEAESARDFVHKLKICLKELQESKRPLRLISRVGMIQLPSRVDSVLTESDELNPHFLPSVTLQTRAYRPMQQTVGEKCRPKSRTSLLHASTSQGYGGGRWKGGRQ